MFKEATFNPNYKTVGNIKPVYDEFAIKNEPMLFDASIDYAYKNGGRITRAVLEVVLNDMQNSSVGFGMGISGYIPHIDTKSVMLMPGMYPCIGGWHCDAVPRNVSTGQPDVDAISENAIHYLVSVNSNVDEPCNTQFIAEPLHCEIDPENGTPIWAQVNASANASNIKTYEVDNGDVVRFTRDSLHRGTAAKAPTWRYFFRLSHTKNEPRNEIRNQVQVYTDINNGW